MGVRADVFDGSSPNIERILSIYFSAFGLLEAPHEVRCAAGHSECRGGEGKG
jgi:hypothetical protein